MKSKEKLLLLSCCAPCSCAVTEYLHGGGISFAVLFYNPNIMPLAEYEKRKEENKRLCAHYGIEFFDLDYDNDFWLSQMKGLEHEPERGARCKKCFALRLKRAAAFAKENGFTSFTSVLGVSRYKSMEDVTSAGLAAAAEAGIAYNASNWRKNGLEELRRKLTKDFGLYEQKYCGCIYSQSGAGAAE